MLTFVAALPQETSPCLKSLDIEEIITCGSFRVARVSNHRTELLLAHGGTGERAVAAALFAMQHFKVTALVSFGLAGGTSPLAERGHLIMATEIISAAGLGKTVAVDPKLQSCLMEAGHKGRIPCHAGPMVTVGKVISSPQEKAFIGSQYRALGLDMESYFLGRLAAEKKLPFGVARAIFDPVEMPIDFPEEIGIDPKKIWKHPRLWSSLPKLTRQFHAASCSLQSLSACL